MAVHHFTAPGLTVARGWQPMETFPRDGSVVEVRDESGTVDQAAWREDQIWMGKGCLSGPPTQWRNPE